MCGKRNFEIAGIALYVGSLDMRWLYIGCRCVRCDLTGCHGDRANEYENYQQLQQAL